MDFNKIYVIQIISVLIILLCIMINILYEKSQPLQYKYGEAISIQENYDSKKEYYSCNDKSLKDYEDSKFDENGILLIEKDNESVYQPSSIAYYGLVLYSKYIETKNIEYLNLAKNQADYLINIQDKENGNFYYDYEFEVSGTNQVLETSWISASAQGQVLSLFSRIYNIDKEEKYKLGCELAIKPFSRTVEENGVCAKLFGYDFYEAYPTEIPNYSLMGHLYSLLGLYDYNEIIGNEEAQKLYDSGIKTLEICLPYYDNNGISLNNLAYLKNDKILKSTNVNHHIKNIALLKTINQIENREIIDYFVSKWEKYMTKDK